MDWSCAPGLRVDDNVDVDGKRLLAKCAALWAHTVSLHWTLLLVIAALVVAYAVGGLQLGPDGGMLLGGTTALGNSLIWWGSERLLGTFART